jgi:NAD(P)-dependent dehydrogenase (short-subunit alcohol dehydrogenase family)
MKTDLSGKVALVNGASRGIGEAIARGLADCGAKVVCTSRRIEGVQAVADAIAAAGGEALAHTCNAGDLEQIESLMQFITSRANAAASIS